VKNDEFVINLEVAGRTYPITIKRGDEQEEYMMRKAAKRVQQNVIQYKQHFAKSLEDRDLLAMVAIQLAMEVVLLEEKNDTKPYTHKIQQLTETLEDYLNGK
jgi:cell division protein ZapA